MIALITEFRGEYRFLSNFWPLNGGTTMTAEHFYQAAKAVSADDQRWVYDAPTPGEAKRRGRRVTVRSDWDDVKLEIMLAVVRAKFTDNDELARRLVATGDAALVEGNEWHDNYWGRCTCARCVRAEIVGQNHLGKILMQVRDELRNRGS